MDHFGLFVLNVKRKSDWNDATLRLCLYYNRLWTSSLSVFCGNGSLYLLKLFFLVQHADGREIGRCNQRSAEPRRVGGGWSRRRPGPGALPVTFQRHPDRLPARPRTPYGTVKLACGVSK